MPRKRMIDPSIWEDENFGRLSPKARILFVGLFSNADDDGYIRGSDAFLRSTVFMYDDMTLSAVRQLADEVSDTMPSVHVYDVDGNRYAHLTKWEDFQTQREDRRTKTTLPQCTICHPISDVGQMSDTRQTRDGQMSAQDKLREVKLSKERGKAKPHARAEYLIALPDEDVEAFKTKYDLEEKPIRQKAEDLYNWCKANGRTYRDYKAFLANALSKDADQLRAKHKPKSRGIDVSHLMEEPS